MRNNFYFKPVPQPNFVKKNSKILISGAGSIGMRHFKNLSTLGYKKLTVCDPDNKRLNAVREIGDYPVYQNFLQALKKEKPTVVLICSPTDLHLQQANQALDYNADIFIEKPLSHRLVGVDNLIKKADKMKRIVMVACNYRFNKGWRTFKKNIVSGGVGKPLFVRVALGYYLPTARKNVNYKKIYAASHRGGGVILDSGSHVVDYLQDLFGKINGGFIHASSGSVLGIMSEEIAIIFLKHERRLESITVLDYISQKSIHRVEVVTNKGMITWNFIDDTVIFENSTVRKVVYRGKKDKNQMFLDELIHFFECVKKRKKPLQDLADARKVLKVLLKR